MPRNDNPIIDATSGILEIPEKFHFTHDDFNSLRPYELLYAYRPGSMKHQIAKNRMSENARNVGFKNFDRTYTAFLNDKQSASATDNGTTAFDGQPLPLKCGHWICNDHGIYTKAASDARQYACTHPIMISGRRYDIDTHEIRVMISFRREKTAWQTIEVPRTTIASPREIIKLSAYGISITSANASALVTFLQNLEDLNYDTIPTKRSVSHLGYVPGVGFAPFSTAITIDTDGAYDHLRDSIHSRGSAVEWLKTALECRQMSTTARIMLAASFAAPLISVLGVLNFYVHLWGIASETGKTVALMLAASVWGNPCKGDFVLTFDATSVGLEHTASFLHQLPICIDEFQTAQVGQEFVYHLAEGTGRRRGTHTGGIARTGTWHTCMLSTGETPIVSDSAGAGAYNRVIEIECVDKGEVIHDGHRIAGLLREHYGHAGEIFTRRIYDSTAVLDSVKARFEENFDRLRTYDTTDKLALSAAAIITADQLATQWIFKDDCALTAADVAKYLASRNTVCRGHRAYAYLCDWVATRANHFLPAVTGSSRDIYGTIDGNTAWIIQSVLRLALEDAGYNAHATLSYLRANNLIEIRPDGKGFGRTKRIGDTTPTCVGLCINNAGESTT